MQALLGGTLSPGTERLQEIALFSTFAPIPTPQSLPKEWILLQSLVAFYRFCFLSSILHFELSSLTSHTRQIEG